MKEYTEPIDTLIDVIIDKLAKDARIMMFSNFVSRNFCFLLLYEKQMTHRFSIFWCFSHFISFSLTAVLTADISDVGFQCVFRTKEQHPGIFCVHFRAELIRRQKRRFPPGHHSRNTPYMKRDFLESVVPQRVS